MMVELNSGYSMETEAVKVKLMDGSSVIYPFEKKVLYSCLEYLGTN